jgi:hypothetical protein
MKKILILALSAGAIYLLYKEYTKEQEKIKVPESPKGCRTHQNMSRGISRLSIKSRQVL